MSRYHMRRIDRALVEPEELASILKRGKYAAVAMCQDGEPYVVTLSYGYDEAANSLVFHLSPSGRKTDAWAADPRVCATVVIDGGYVKGECRHLYESVVVSGRMTVITDPDEARDAMRTLLAHLEEEPDDVWERQALDRPETWRRLAVARLVIEDITGKAGH